MSRTVAHSKTAAWVDIQREDDEAIKEILFLLKRFMESVRNDLNVLPLETAISLLRHATEKDCSKEELSILHHHLRRALLMRYSFFGCIEDLEACFVSPSKGIAIVVAKGTTGRDIEKVEEIQAAIQLIDECRQSIDTATLDDIIEVAMESIQLYTEGKQVLQMGELLILLGNVVGMRYLGCLGEGNLELTYAANKFREAEYLCRNDFPLTYVCLTALAHIGWLRATERGHSEGMIDGGDHMKKALVIDEEGAKSFRIGSTMAEEAAEISQLQEAITHLRFSMHCRMSHHPQRFSTLNHLAHGLAKKYSWGGSLEDLEESILLRKEGLRLMSTHHPDRAIWLNGLANALVTRFSEKGAMQDLEECILLHRQALDLRCHPHPNRSTSLNNLASALWTRFSQEGAMQDLEECILLHREALDLRSHPHLDRSTSLNNLALALSTRFSQTGAMQDLEECILLHRQALDLRCHPHPDRSSSLNNLAFALSTRFSQTGAMQDLEECILLHRQALDLRCHPHPDRSTSLNNLANALSTRFWQTGAMQDLEECILLHRQALDLRCHPHPDRSSSLNNLAFALSTRFSQTGAMQDLEECILLHRQALDLRCHPHPDRSTSLNNLANALSTRFWQKGAMQDLEECILLHREALDLLCPPHPNRSSSLNNLAFALSTRFSQTGAMQDLEECILLHRQALDLQCHTHPDRSTSLNNLASALKTRFGQKGAMQDLEECILLNREALDLRCHSHPNRSTSLNNLASALSTRFEQKGAMHDLEECILLHREALDLRCHPHPNRSTSLNNLASAFSTRFKQTNAMQDFEEGIQLYQQALELRCPPDPNRLSTLYNLAVLHKAWYDHNHEVANLEQALVYFELASRYETGPMLSRLDSVKAHATLARIHRPTASLEAYIYALELLPQLASIDLTLKHRHDVLEHSRDLVCDATQCAISQNQLETAVVFLSTSRSIFWTQALQLRTPVDELAAVNPSLAEKYLDISRQLERASHDSTSHPHTPLASDGHTSNQPDFTSLSTLVEHRRQAIEDIRKIPGFEEFLLPPSFSSLKHAARNGPVILLNASKYGCDALIMHESGAVDHVALADINLGYLKALKLLVHTSLTSGWRSTDGTQPEVQTAIDVLRTLLPRDFVPESEGLQPDMDRHALRFVLIILWDKVVQHVVEALALSKTSSPKRIWWCPTGLFASLPIHAAGIYFDNEEPIDCLFQYAVSSYCTSPKDLLHAQTQISPDFKMTAIIEPEASGGNSLPFTVTELDTIMSRVPDQWQQLNVRLGFKGAPNQIEDVLHDIQLSSIVHFGCHGNQNLRDPLESYLLLSGGRLTISRIIQECQVSNSAGLAYLSACETAKGDDDRLDESLNLVASMMFAGFRSVVGTMWSIFDCDAPIVADVFYGYLFRMQR